MPTPIKCPSGLSGEIRELKVKELNILADRRLAKGGGQIAQILSSCWLSTTDAGPYEFTNGTVDWDRVLQGDRFYVLLQIRALSLGETYSFGQVCQVDSCRHRFEWEVDLNDLPVKPLTDEARQRFVQGNRFETAIASSRQRVWFRLLTGADERRFARIRTAQREALWSAMLALRIHEIENVPAADQRSFIQDLGLADAERLRAAFDEMDCGVETGIEIECPECLTVQEVELPLDQRFFLPSPKQRPKQTVSMASSLT